MTSPRSNDAKTLAARWKLDVAHALYRKNGTWYHLPERFPAALLDEHGYVIFETEAAFHACPELRIGRQVGVPGGIAEISGYTRGVALPPSYQSASTLASMTAEAAVMREGASIDGFQSRRERDPAARAACIIAPGHACAVCGLDFVRRYGTIGEGFIHVHHVTPLAEGERDVAPAEDLRPVCPNCHAMLHRRSPPLTIAELQATLRDDSDTVRARSCT